MQLEKPEKRGFQGLHSLYEVGILGQYLADGPSILPVVTKQLFETRVSGLTLAVEEVL